MKPEWEPKREEKVHPLQSDWVRFGAAQHRNRTRPLATETRCRTLLHSKPRTIELFRWIAAGYSEKQASPPAPADRERCHPTQLAWYWFSNRQRRLSGQ